MSRISETEDATDSAPDGAPPGRPSRTGWLVAGIAAGVAALFITVLLVGLHLADRPRDGFGADQAALSPPQIYQQRCQSCHQADGLGKPGLYPPLAGSEWVSGPPWRLRRILLNGAQETMTVKGEAWSSQSMPFFSWLSNADLSAVLTYVRCNAAWGNRAAPIAAADFAATRAIVGKRRRPWTPAELMALTADDPGVAAPPPAAPAAAAAGL